MGKFQSKPMTPSEPVEEMYIHPILLSGENGPLVEIFSFLPPEEIFRNVIFVNKTFHRVSFFMMEDNKYKWNRNHIKPLFGSIKPTLDREKFPFACEELTMKIVDLLKLRRIPSSSFGDFDIISYSAKRGFSKMFKHEVLKLLPEQRKPSSNTLELAFRSHEEGKISSDQLLDICHTLFEHFPADIRINEPVMEFLIEKNDLKSFQHIFSSKNNKEPQFSIERSERHRYIKQLVSGKITSSSDLKKRQEIITLLTENNFYRFESLSEFLKRVGNCPPEIYETALRSPVGIRPHYGGSNMFVSNQVTQYLIRRSRTEVLEEILKLQCRDKGKNFQGRRLLDRILPCPEMINYLLLFKPSDDLLLRTYLKVIFTQYDSNPRNGHGYSLHHHRKFYVPLRSIITHHHLNKRLVGRTENLSSEEEKSKLIISHYEKKIKTIFQFNPSGEQLTIMEDCVTFFRVTSETIYHFTSHPEIFHFLLGYMSEGELLSTLNAISKSNKVSKKRKIQFYNWILEADPFEDDQLRTLMTLDEDEGLPSIDHYLQEIIPKILNGEREDEIDRLRDVLSWCLIHCKREDNHQLLIKFLDVCVRYSGRLRSVIKYSSFFGNFFGRNRNNIYFDVSRSMEEDVEERRKEDLPFIKTFFNSNPKYLSLIDEDVNLVDVIYHCFGSYYRVQQQTEQTTTKSYIEPKEITEEDGICRIVFKSLSYGPQLHLGGRYEVTDEMVGYCIENNNSETFDLLRYLVETRHYEPSDVKRFGSILRSEERSEVIEFLVSSLVGTGRWKPWFILEFPSLEKRKELVGGCLEKSLFECAECKKQLDVIKEEFFKCWDCEQKEQNDDYDDIFRRRRRRRRRRRFDDIQYDDRMMDFGGEIGGFDQEEEENEGEQPEKKSEDKDEKIRSKLEKNLYCGECIVEGERMETVCGRKQYYEEMVKRKICRKCKGEK